MSRFLPRLFRIGLLAVACAGLFDIATAEDALAPRASAVRPGSNKNYGKPAPSDKAAPEERAAARAPEASAAAPEPLPAQTITQTNDLPSSGVLNQLERIEKMHGQIQTISAEFDQTRVSKEFSDETKSRGKLQIKKPNQLRCEYQNPEPSVLLFTSNTLYQYTPTLKQADKFVYRTEQDADEFFRTLTLSFGLSSQQILGSYRVALVKKGSEDAPAGTFGLSFYPLKTETSRDYSEIRVFFSASDESKVLPVRVRLFQTSGDETTLEIQNVQLNTQMPDKNFAADFPRGTEVIEH
ncbi:TPA: hypothetical protein DDW35_00380 [Candidatus Sumerlaeota bacterium]|jgi:outer membrane lipoprotein carrier protein|nr:hypothetical protein [Candidatus Sumerlaeota bacterium]